MRFTRSLVFSAALWVAGPCVLAAPSDAPADEISRFLIDKGLLGQIGGQIEQVRQTVSEKASDLVMNAMGFLGVPYRRGGTNPETGFDCSGFVRAMFQQTVGLILPRSADQQAAATQTIDKSDLRPGDLVFFNTMRRAFSHVGIYIGDNKFIHSPRPGSEVRVEDMRMGYWQARFNGARRVESPSAQP
jgi:cell wall-associated NlpC family hydrolase